MSKIVIKKIITNIDRLSDAFDNLGIFSAYPSTRTQALGGEEEGEVGGGGGGGGLLLIMAKAPFVHV